MIDWNVTNSHRLDLTYRTGADRFGRVGGRSVPIQVLEEEVQALEAHAEVVPHERGDGGRRHRLQRAHDGGAHARQRRII